MGHEEPDQIEQPRPAEATTEGPERVESPAQKERAAAEQKFYDLYKRDAMKFSSVEAAAKEAAGVSPQEILYAEQAERNSIAKEKDRVWGEARKAGITPEEALKIVDRALADARSEYIKSLQSSVESGNRSAVSRLGEMKKIVHTPEEGPEQESPEALREEARHIGRSTWAINMALYDEVPELQAIIAEEQALYASGASKEEIRKSGKLDELRRMILEIENGLWRRQIEIESTLGRGPTLEAARRGAKEIDESMYKRQQGGKEPDLFRFL